MPPSVEDFSHRFRSLTTDQRAAFITELLSVQGWDTDRDGRLIYASKGQETRRIYVGNLPPEIEDVDEMVSVPSRLSQIRAILPGLTGVSLHDRAQESGPTVLGPAAIHEQLLYAVDREEAAKLYRDHFGTEFDTLNSRDDKPVSKLPLRVAVVSVLIVAGLAASPVLVGVVSNGPFWDDPPSDGFSDTNGITPSNSSSKSGNRTETTTIPSSTKLSNLSSRDILNLDRLVLAQSRILEDETVEMYARFRGPRFLTRFDSRRSGFDTDDKITLQAHVESGTRYHIIRTTNFNGSSLTSAEARIEWFANGTTEYQRIKQSGSIDYDQKPVSTSQNGSATLNTWSKLILVRYFNTTERRVETSDTGSETQYRLVATGEPLTLPHRHRIRDYRAVAVIESDGWVNDVQVTYTHLNTGARVQVTARYDRSPGAVAPPKWYNEVTNELIQDVRFRLSG